VASDTRHGYYAHFIFVDLGDAIHPHFGANKKQTKTDNNKQQHGDSIATMLTAVFVTKQQPTVNIIISITQIVLTIVDDAVSSSLMVVSLAVPDKEASGRVSKSFRSARSTKATQKTKKGQF
jgi:hypothetical protein